MANKNKMTGYSVMIENGDAVMVATGFCKTPISDRRNLCYSVVIHTQTPFCGTYFWDPSMMYHLIAEVTENRNGVHTRLSTCEAEAETPEDMAAWAATLRLEAISGGNLHDPLTSWITIKPAEAA